MTQPSRDHITLQSNEDQIRELIQDLFIHPRIQLLKWSMRTNQTAQVRIAYPGQHLASLVTGVPGGGSAARGDDLADGSEVKTCSRADQLGRCKATNCGQRVLPSQEACTSCGSSNIERKKDSHWILSMKSKTERDQYLNCVRIVLVLFDRPENMPTDVRIRVWEVWPKDDRHSYFRWFIDDYWTKNYSVKIDKGLNPAPLNLHPLKCDFFMMNPLPTFHASVRVGDESVDLRDRIVHIDEWIKPTTDRSGLPSQDMPASAVRPAAVRQALLNKLVEQSNPEALAKLLNLPMGEVTHLRSTISEEALAQKIEHIPEWARKLVPLPSKRPKMTPSTYRRGQ